MPFISVIIPTFNRARCILRALDSVLAQSYRNFDIWVIDDGGNDHTGTLVKNRVPEASGVDIHYIYTPNKGVAAARNCAIHESAGVWIALLDSDDEWMVEKLETQVNCIERNPDIFLFHSQEEWIRHGIRVNPPQSYRKYGGDVFIQCLPVCMIGPSTTLFHRSLFEDTGGFDEDYPVCEDYDFWLRVASRYEVGLIDKPLTIKYGGHEDQLSTSHVATDYWRVKSLCRILQIRTLTPDRVDAVFKEISRKGRILLYGYRKHGRMKEYHEVLSLIRTVHKTFRLD